MVSTIFGIQAVELLLNLFLGAVAPGAMGNWVGMWVEVIATTLGGWEEVIAATLGGWEEDALRVGKAGWVVVGGLFGSL